MGGMVLVLGLHNIYFSVNVRTISPSCPAVRKRHGFISCGCSLNIRRILNSVSLVTNSRCPPFPMSVPISLDMS